MRRHLIQMLGLGAQLGAHSIHLRGGALGLSRHVLSMVLQHFCSQGYASDCIFRGFDQGIRTIL